MRKCGSLESGEDCYVRNFVWQMSQREIEDVVDEQLYKVNRTGKTSSRHQQQ